MHPALTKSVVFRASSRDLFSSEYCCCFFVVVLLFRYLTACSCCFCVCVFCCCFVCLVGWLLLYSVCVAVCCNEDLSCFIFGVNM